jgi:hypothetical protein
MAGAGLAGVILVLAAGCTTSQGRFEREKMIVDLADALREEALNLPPNSQRERLVSGLIQLRELMMTETILKPIEEAPNAPRLPTPEGGVKSDPAWAAMFAPKTIAIGVFTKSKSFSGQEGDEGLEVHLHTLDQFGDPTKAVGWYRVEVFAYRTASTDKRGERLGHWIVKVLDADSQRKYYDRVDRCYVFPLLWEKGVEPGKAVVVQATYYPPGGFEKKLFAQRIIKLQEPEE